MNIQIACKGATEVALAELSELQGNLKDLSEQNYVKLRNSITEFGFSFPIFMWEDPLTNKKWIIDAHHRIKTLRKMEEEGWVIPRLPADYIHAKDKKEAKKKLLLVNSRYAKITEEGLYSFNNEPSFEIDASFSEFLEIPEIDFTVDNIQVKQKGEPKTEELVTCPSCKHQFLPSEAKLAE